MTVIVDIATTVARYFYCVELIYIGSKMAVMLLVLVAVPGGDNPPHCRHSHSFHSDAAVCPTVSPSYPVRHTVMVGALAQSPMF